jgi:hypothetical protein
MKTSNLGTSVKNRVGSFYETVLKTSAVTYTMVLFVAILGGGCMIRLYGETCGLNILEPSTWLKSTVSIGSPWCKTLNLVGYIATNIVEHIWLHLFGLLGTYLVAYLPGNLKSLWVRDYH